MRMISTRGDDRGLTYADVLLEGLAPDGGLYMPSDYPQFSREELDSLLDAKYEDVALCVIEKFVYGSIPFDAFERLIAEAYSDAHFEKERGEVAPLAPIGEGLYVQNLSLGPTASFKDMAMQLLGREMSYQLEKERKSLFILGATSGDTGSAAEAAVKGLNNIRVCMLSPEKGMSEFQKAQMGSLSSDTIWNVSVRGRFDDCQDLVKAVKADKEFAHLGAVNSINWGRVAAQVAYYFSGCLQAMRMGHKEVDLAVPSGNFGNAFSGYVAKMMGAPIRRIIVATNENDILDRLLKTGVYESRMAQITSSPSMDISRASNYERLLFDVCGRDPQITATYMAEFAIGGRVDMKDYKLDKSLFAEKGFVSGSSTHADRIRAMQKVYKDSKVIIDPHTADGVHVAMQLKSDLPVICLATALPVKFEETVKEALGFVLERPARFKEMKLGTGEGFTAMDAKAEDLKGFLREHM